jgi:hypothetical protein
VTAIGVVLVWHRDHQNQKGECILSSLDRSSAPTPIGCKRCPRQPCLSSLTDLLPIKKAATEVTAKFREETSKKAALGCQVQIALHNGMRKGGSTRASRFGSFKGACVMTAPH